MAKSGVVVGLPWYREADWSTFKRMLADADGLHDTYAEWLVDAENLERELRKEGHLVKRVQLDPSVFRGWCLLRGMAMDGSARSQYAADQVRLQDQPQSTPDQ